MTWFAILAFVVTPAGVVALGYVALRWHEREAVRVEREIARQRLPAEISGY